MTTTAPAIRLTAADVNHASPDAQSLAVHLDDRWVGWVGTARKWRGHSYGGLKWWACWREDGDTHARWSSESTAYPTRKAALAALQAERARPRDPNERTSPKALTTAVERWCTHGLVTRRRDWSDGSAELELRGNYAISIVREDGVVGWEVITRGLGQVLPKDLDQVTEGELVHDREAAVSKLVALVEKWADR
ncbi:hypothetical protein ACTWPB_07750 [Nocardia sp. IBHARD005]|uniref:hypothetical protein n=1 Tax=Nocardia sp. IBHARD005 TaxID=3457765 RepID=UPI00405900C2